MSALFLFYLFHFTLIFIKFSKILTFLNTKYITKTNRHVYIDKRLGNLFNLPQIFVLIFFN